MNLHELIIQQYRSRGRWEILATALGEEAAVETTMRGLSATELQKKANGKAIAPSMIRERVEALAAYNPHLLASLTQQWLDPQHIHSDYWWTAAWYPSLRHLKQLGVIQREMVDVPALHREVDILWYAPDPSPISWHLLLDYLAQKGGQAFDLIRKEAARPLIEPTLSAHDLATAPIYTLRLLRDRTELLDHSARGWLEMMVRTQANRTCIGLVYIIELCKELAIPIPETTEAELGAELLQGDLDDLAGTVYTLLTDWRIP
jgi:hypothetical protein